MQLEAAAALEEAERRALQERLRGQVRTHARAPGRLGLITSRTALLLPSPRCCCWQNLHTAARRGLNQILGELLQQGADVNERDEETDTPLMAAAEWDREEAITILLDAGADIDAVNRVGLV